MARGSDVLETVPNPQAKGPGQITLPVESLAPTGENGLFRPESNPPGALKMCRLKAWKNSALKSMVARSPKILVFLPSARLSSRSPHVRAWARDRGSLPKVKGATVENAAAL